MIAHAPEYGCNIWNLVKVNDDQFEISLAEDKMHSGLQTGWKLCAQVKVDDLLGKKYFNVYLDSCPSKSYLWKIKDCGEGRFQILLAQDSQNLGILNWVLAAPAPADEKDKRNKSSEYLQIVPKSDEKWSFIRLDAS